MLMQETIKVETHTLSKICSTYNSQTRTTICDAPCMYEGCHRCKTTAYHVLRS